LQNKPLAGSVLAIVSILLLALLFIAATWAVRKRRRHELESISFDPNDTSEAYGGIGEAGQGWSDKRSISNSVSGHGHDNMYNEPAMYPTYGPTQYPVVPVQEMAYAQHGYQNQQTGWNQSSAYGYPAPAMPVYNPSQPSRPAVSRVPPPPPVSRPVPAASIPYVKDALPPLPVASGTDNSSSESESSQSNLPTPPAPIAKESNASVSRIPAAGPLPDTFGSDDLNNRDSVEMDAQFWSGTLKIANQ